MHQDPEYLSVKEVAERLHVTTRTIYELLWRGQIEGVKRVGDAVRIPSGIRDADQVDTLEAGEHAAVMAAHHAETDESCAKVRHDQAPALARALTALTMRSRSFAVNDG